MTDDSSDLRPRPSIEERAARRRDLQRAYPDRYSGLLHVLLGRRDGERGRLRSDPARWHPVARKLMIGALIAVVAVVAGSVVHGIWREGRVDTWSGPTDTVTSGQRMLACLPEGTQTHEQLPTWIRYGDRVFAQTRFVRALRGQGQPDMTGQIETGYSHDGMRILLPVGQPPAEAPTRLFVVIDRSPAATIFDWAPACA